MRSQQVAREYTKSTAHFSGSSTTILEEKIAHQGLVIDSFRKDIFVQVSYKSIFQSWRETCPIETLSLDSALSLSCTLQLQRNTGCWIRIQITFVWSVFGFFGFFCVLFCFVLLMDLFSTMSETESSIITCYFFIKISEIYFSIILTVFFRWHSNMKSVLLFSNN